MKKNNMKKNMKRNHGGFSLVEVLIALSILTIVCGMAFRVMSTSSSLFSNANAEVNIQSEAQSAANAIKELIIDCQVAVDYYDTKKDATRVFTDLDGTVYENAFLVANNNEQFLIYPNKTAGKEDELLYVSRKRNVATGSFDTSFNPADAEVLAEYVNDFTVDTSRFDTTKMIDFKFDYVLRGESYKGEYQVRMRNDIIISGKTDYEIKNEMKVSQVYVNPPSWEIRPSSTPAVNIIDDVKFTSVVKTVGPVDTSVTWSVDPEVPGCSIDENGLMKMTEEPNVDSFRVVATSKSDPTQMGASVVKVKKVTNVSVSALSGVTGTLEGVESVNLMGQVHMGAVVDGWNLGSNEQSVYWKLEYKPLYTYEGEYTVLTYFDETLGGYVDKDESVASITPGGLITLGSNAANNFEFKVTATAMFPNYGYPVTYKSSSTLLRVKNSEVEFDGNFIRGYNINLKNYFLSGKASSDYSTGSEKGISNEVTEIKGYDSASYWDGTAWRNLHVDSAQLANGVLYVDEESIKLGDAELNKKYYEDLNIKVKVRDQNNESKELKLTLPSVAMSVGEPVTSYIVARKGTTVNILFSYVGMNILDRNQIGIYIDGDKVSSSGASGVNQFWSAYLNTTKADGNSALGTRNDYVNKQTVRLAANSASTDKHYPKEPASLIIALDDFYQVSSKVSSSFKEYKIYIANVEGQGIFVPVPDTKDFPAVTDKMKEYTNVGPTKLTVKLQKSGSKYYMEYGSKTYVYDNIYSYWKLK